MHRPINCSEDDNDDNDRGSGLRCKSGVGGKMFRVRNPSSAMRRQQQEAGNR